MLKKKTDATLHNSQVGTKDIDIDVLLLSKILMSIRDKYAYTETVFRLLLVLND